MTILQADKNIMATLQTAKELKQQIKTIELLLNPYLETIREYMGKSTILLSNTGAEIATYKQNKPSIIFNVKLFAEQRPKIYKQYLEEKEGNRPLVLT